MISSHNFTSFGRPCSGRLVTSGAGFLVVNGRNPYGSHNLVIVNKETNTAIRHGAESVVAASYLWLPIKSYRKVRRFLADRGIARDWAVMPNSD